MVIALYSGRGLCSNGTEIPVTTPIIYQIIFYPLAATASTYRPIFLRVNQMNNALQYLYDHNQEEKGVLRHHD